MVNTSGWAVSLSATGEFLAVGGPYDFYYRGATWIFQYDGNGYKQFGKKLVGTGITYCTVVSSFFLHGAGVVLIHNEQLIQENM